jgi:hypothetical protein
MTTCDTDDVKEVDGYWLAGIWDDHGKLLWSSEPESYDTRAEAVEEARLKNDAEFQQAWWGAEFVS